MQLSDEERNALGAAMDLPEDEARARSQARPHPLVQPGADGKAALDLADRVVGPAAKALTIAMVSETRTPWDIQPGPPELVDQPVTRVANASLALAVATPQGGGALLFGGGMAQALIRAMLGLPVDAAEPVAPGELGVADRPVVTRLMSVFVREIGAALTAAGGLPLAPGPLVDDPTRLTGLKAPLLSLTMRFLSPLEGSFELLLPVQVAGQVPQTIGTARVAHHVPHLEVEVVAELGRARIRLSELGQLKPGMELKLDTHEGALLPLLVDDKVRLLGRPMAADGRLAVQIALKDSRAVPMKAPKDTAPRSGSVG